MARDSDLLKRSNVLLTFFKSEFLKKKGYPPTINRYKDKWGMRDILYDCDEGAVRKTISYYIDVHHSPTLAYFYSHFNALNLAVQQQENDRVYRGKRRRETKRLAEQWNKG